MATLSLLLFRILAGLTAMLIAVWAGDALSAPLHPPGKPHHGPAPKPGFCASYPAYHLMRHPHHGGVGYFHVDGGRCLWAAGASKPRHVTHAAPKAAPVLPVRTAPAPALPEPSAEAPYCREYTDRIRIGGDAVAAYGTACLKPDGAWELQQGAAPAAGAFCREFERRVTVGTGETTQTGTACLRPGDVWEIVRTDP